MRVRVPGDTARPAPPALPVGACGARAPTAAPRKPAAARRNPAEAGLNPVGSGSGPAEPALRTL